MTGPLPQQFACLSGQVFRGCRWGLVWCRAGMVCCLLPGFCGCVLLLGWQCGGEPSRADVACWGGWGPHTPCARQIGPHPPQPTPPSRHSPLRCVWVRMQKCGLPYSGAGAHGFARARGEASDNLCSQRAEDGSPLVRAQSAAAPPQPGRPPTRVGIPEASPPPPQTPHHYTPAPAYACSPAQFFC